MNFKNYLWLVPFLSFACGYFIMQQIFRTPESITPAFIGKQIHEILPIVTQHKLNIRLLDHKEETDLPEGIILNQTPAAGTLIKPNQPLFVVTTKKPLAVRAPQCIGLPIDDVIQQLKPTEIRPRIYHLPHAYPEKMCFAQSPAAQEPLEKNRLIFYISSGNNKPVIWPNFMHQPLQEVINFLQMYNIKPHIISDAPYKQNNNPDYVVIDQRPFAGTLLTLDENKPLSVQLRVH